MMLVIFLSRPERLSTEVTSLHKPVSDEYKQADVALATFVHVVEMTATRNGPPCPWQPWFRGTEHRRRKANQARQGDAALVARHRVPDDELITGLDVHAVGGGAEEDAAVAAVHGHPAAEVRPGRLKGGGREESAASWHVLEKSQDGRRPVELAVAAAEAGVGGDAAPRLADGGGADEVLGLIRREAEEYLLEERARQHRRRRRRYGAAAEARVSGGLGIKGRARERNRVGGRGLSEAAATGRPLRRVRPSTPAAAWFDGGGEGFGRRAQGE
ncbi:hypothetical protein BRADI_1g58845v3 [Brachypodium distachyon]|uniref:DUF834 domain-containing protein n=1 Tax=Brachypodium distachyon TaxID=15368 RepID=A0A0Q3LDP1_BRADI|nr:hypothetical protein BRADI_1g58845v3 [Brachypodium distachyon]